jgi:hypothetical protein
MNLNRKIIFWSMTPCNFVGIYWRFRTICCLQLQGRRASRAGKMLWYGNERKDTASRAYQLGDGGAEIIREEVEKTCLRGENNDKMFINIFWIICFLTSVLVKISGFDKQDTCLRPTCPFPGSSRSAHWVFPNASTSLWNRRPSHFTLHLPKQSFSHLFPSSNISSYVLPSLCLLNLFLVPPPPIGWLAEPCSFFLSSYLNVLSLCGLLLYPEDGGRMFLQNVLLHVVTF